MKLEPKIIIDVEKYNYRLTGHREYKDVFSPISALVLEKSVHTFSSLIDYVNFKIAYEERCDH